jgi:spore germination protein GerM
MLARDNGYVETMKARRVMKAYAGSKHWTLVAALVLAAALSVVLVACGGDEDEPVVSTQPLVTQVAGSSTTDTTAGAGQEPVTTVTAAPSTTATAAATTTTAVKPSPATTKAKATATTATKTTTKTVAKSKTVKVKVYFLKGEELASVTREIPRTEKVGTAALELLLAGPSAGEKAKGLSTAIPADTKVRSLKVANGLATVDLTSKFESGGGTLSMYSRLGQVVYTLTEFPTVQKVQLQLNGKTVTALGGEGLVIGSSLSRAGYDKLIQGGGTTPTTKPATATKTRFEVYFVRDEKLVAVQRTVDYTPGVAKAAIGSLLAGPTPSEQGAGLVSAVPAGVRLNGVSIKDKVAVVDVSSGFGSGGGSLSMHLRLGQVVYTMTQFPTVDRVELRLDGQKVTALGGEGLLIQKALSRTEWANLMK